MIFRRVVSGMALFLPLGIAMTAFSFDFSQVEKKVVEYNLDNGLKIIVLPRHDAPVVSFVTMVNVGNVDDPKGFTGISHMFEHMAFKGTKEIGTTDIKKEEKWMAEEDRIFGLIRAEKSKLNKVDSAKLADLDRQLQMAMDSSGQYVIPNEFDQIAKREGATNLNAGTGYDITVYYLNYPANRLELWMAMESDRLLNPVLREFYKEQQVVAEERRMRKESSPQGKLQEELLSAAYKAHPYHYTLGGYMSDIQNFDRFTAAALYKKYYVPGNMVVVIVGDVNPDQVYTLARKYFGRIPAGPKPEPILTVEPPQGSERRVILREKSQPILFSVYHIPNAIHPDMPALDALADYLGQGRTSQLYTTLVKEQKIATMVMAFAGYPAVKYPTLFCVVSVPSKDHSNAENEVEIQKTIDKVKNELIPDEEVRKIKARAKASLINNLSSNSGLAMQLANYAIIAGDWHLLFHEMERVDAVTAQDIKRVANQYLNLSNRTIGLLESQEN
jgi:predicted Zn-dependent peptidase